MVDEITAGRTDGALVRLTTPILVSEAKARLQNMLKQVQTTLPRFIPEA